MRFRLSRGRLLSGLFVSTLASGTAMAMAQAANNEIDVLIDQASLVRLERPAAEIVVGNPSIADVSVQNGKTLVLTGKSYGETNLIVVDADGKVIISRRLIVQEPRAGFVTIYKGTARETVHCSPHCSDVLAIGDSTEYFDSVSKQIRTKQSISQTSAEGSKQSD